jgi:hypothetical protein
MLLIITGNYFIFSVAYPDMFSDRLIISTENIIGKGNGG